MASGVANCASQVNRPKKLGANGTTKVCTCSTICWLLVCSVVDDYQFSGTILRPQASVRWKELAVDKSTCWPEDQTLKVKTSLQFMIDKSTHVTLYIARRGGVASCLVHNSNSMRIKMREFLIWHWKNESFLSWPWNFLRSLFDTHFNFHP